MAAAPVLSHEKRDQLDSLANHIAQLSLRIDLAKHAFLTALRQFAACEGWAGSGFPSLPAWLSWRIGITPTTAREYVRVAKALGKFPQFHRRQGSNRFAARRVYGLGARTVPVRSTSQKTTVCSFSSTFV